MKLNTYLVTNPDKISRMKQAETSHHAKNLCLEQDKFKWLPVKYKCRKLV